MAGREKIYTLDLIYKGVPVPFLFRTMEEIDKAADGIADNPHRHSYYTVIWPFSATGRHIIDFREYPVIQDHIFFVSPWQVHQVITDPDPTGYVILFTPEFLERSSIRNDFIVNLKLFRGSDETPPLMVEDKMASRLRIFADNMRSAFEMQDDMYLERIGAYLKLFLIECNSHCSLSRDTNLQNIEVSKTIVRNFKSLVEKNYTRWHQVKDYAEALNVTPNYLNEVIRSSLSVPAKEFVQNRLILEAKRMVLFTEKSSKEIGYDLGFEDPSHFSKFFRTSAGQSLIEFRESITFNSGLTVL
jgi:AraC family transcriptional regulator, transcriptional activator of pobA